MCVCVCVCSINLCILRLGIVTCVIVCAFLSLFRCVWKICLLLVDMLLQILGFLIFRVVSLDWLEFVSE
jgi:hypothetical protein